MKTPVMTIHYRWKMEHQDRSTREPRMREYSFTQRPIHNRESVSYQRYSNDERTDVTDLLDELPSFRYVVT